ncbi:iron ABC transporter permease [soil metagenome]
MTADTIAVPAGLSGRVRRARVVAALLIVLLLATALLSIASGPVPLSLGTVLDVLRGSAAAADRDSTIVWQIRMPRTILAMLVGGALALAGTIMQGLFRNPLADPGFVGVSSGASFAAIVIIVLAHPWLGTAESPAIVYALPVAAFLGALVSTILVYRIATRRGQTSVAIMLLGGIAIAALMNAGTGSLIFLSSDQQLRDFQFWSLGSLGGASWRKVAAVMPFILGTMALIRSFGRGLNAFALGETEARHLGVSTQRLKRLAILAIAILTGAAVAVSGTIGFIGLVVPHLLRLTIGPDHHALLPSAALLGAILLLAADMVSRVIVAPAELPIGIITALAGAPFFLWVLLRTKTAIDL